MKSSSRVLCAALLALTAALPLRAQDQSAFITDFLGQVEYAQRQILALEEAVPQEKYAWRPAEGVRSIGEVYRHLTQGNYYLMQIAGIQPPADVNIMVEEKKWETAVTDKAGIASALVKSFEHVKSSTAKMTDADLAVMVDFFGNRVTKRSALMSTLNHMHEHLGQAIAYARMNGIVPPWTAAEMAKQAEKEKGK